MNIQFSKIQYSLNSYLGLFLCINSHSSLNPHLSSFYFPPVLIETTPCSDRNLCKDTVWPSGLTGISEATIGSSVYQISHTVHLSPPISSEGPYPGSCPEQHLIFCCSMLCRFRILFFTIFLFKELVTFWKCILLTSNFLYKVLCFCVCMHLSSVELT